MKKSSFYIGAITLVALAISGCASNGSSAQTASESSDVGSEVQVEEADNTATVAEYAGEVAVLHDDVDDWLEDWDDTLCSVRTDDLTCDLQAMTGSMVAQTAAVSLDTLSKETAPGFVGHPPAEIAELYETTLEVAEEAEEAGLAYDDLDCPDDDGCMSAVIELERAMDDLSEQFTRWSPYT